MNKLVAQCPSCQTRYNVTQGQLKVADGRVRCGQCLTVFRVPSKTPKVSTIKDAPDIPKAKSQSVQQAPTETQSTSQIQTKLLSSAVAQRLQQRNLKHAPDPLTLLRQIRPDPLELIPSANMPGPSQKLGIIGSLLALVLLAGQYLWFERAKLAQDALLHPLYAALCDQLDCSPPSSQSLPWLQTSHLLIRSQPEQPDTLEVLTGLINTGPLPARLPIMRLHFSNASGNILAADDFPPGIYLADTEITRLQPGQQYEFRLILQRPALGHLGYELDWLPAAAP